MLVKMGKLVEKFKSGDKKKHKERQRNVAKQRRKILRKLNRIS
jgi:hypothetical protein